MKSFINDYDLFKWDDPKQAGAKVDEKLMGRIAKQMGSEGGGTGGAASRSSDKGFRFIPHGETVEVIKLPENRTF